MGNLLRLLMKDEPEPNFDAFVDFEKCRPTPSEEAVWNQVQPVLSRSQNILAKLSDYSHSSTLVQKARLNPNDPEINKAAASALGELVVVLSACYNFSQDLETVLPTLLAELSNSTKTPLEHLETQQALFKQFSEILDFTLRFDYLKENNNEMPSAGIMDKMTWFLATFTPLLQHVCDVIRKSVSDNNADAKSSLHNVCESLRVGGHLCREMIQRPSFRNNFTNPESLSFCLRVMVASIVLYDHINPLGCYNKQSRFDVKPCLQLLITEAHSQTNGNVAMESQKLIDVLKYSSVHLNDPTTPRHVRVMLALDTNTAVC